MSVRRADFALSPNLSPKGRKAANPDFSVSKDEELNPESPAGAGGIEPPLSASICQNWMDAVPPDTTKPKWIGDRIDLSQIQLGCRQ